MIFLHTLYWGIPYGVEELKDIRFRPETLAGKLGIFLPPKRLSLSRWSYFYNSILCILLKLFTLTILDPFAASQGIWLVYAPLLLHSGRPLSAVPIADAVRDRFELLLEFQRDRISFHKVKTVNLYHVATTGLTDFAFCLRLRLWQLLLLLLLLLPVFRN